MNQTFEQKAVEIIGQLQHLAPKAADVALQTARINALGDVIEGVFSLIVFGCLVLFWRKIYWRWANNGADEIAVGLSGAGLAIAMAFFAVGAFIDLVNIWTWVGIFHPELALAHKII